MESPQFNPGPWKHLAPQAKKLTRSGKPPPKKKKKKKLTLVKTRTNSQRGRPILRLKNIENYRVNC